MQSEVSDVLIPVFPHKAAVIIDGGYWEAIRKSAGIQSINLIKLSEDLCKPAYRVRTYYFDGKSKSKSRQSFFDSLKMLERFEVVLGEIVSRDIQCKKCDDSFKVYEQKQVDMLIAVNIVRLATTKQIDMIVLVAGDQDFLPVIKVAKQEGVLIKLAYGTSKTATVASGLLQEADERIVLTEELLKGYDLKESVTEEAKTLIQKRVKEDIEVNEETINQIIEYLKELMIKERTSKIRASDLGIYLQEKKLIFERQLKDLEILAKERIASIIENKELFFSLKGKEKDDLIKEIKKIEDPAVKFLLESLDELLKERDMDRIYVAHLGARMMQKKPTWKEEYGITKTQALTRLIKRAEEYLEIEEEGNIMKVGLKEL